MASCVVPRTRACSASVWGRVGGITRVGRVWVVFVESESLVDLCGGFDLTTGDGGRSVTVVLKPLPLSIGLRIDFHAVGKE